MSTVKDRLEDAKNHLEKSCGALVRPPKDATQYNLCMALWCLADALLKMQDDIEIIKDEVWKMKHK